jgi:hypothetical protein
MQLHATSRSNHSFKGVFMRTLVLALSFYSSFASACMYHIDPVAKAAELKTVALASLGVNEASLISAEVLSFNYFESISTPMCPEELTHTAKFQVTYTQNSSQCVVELEVKKVEPFVSQNDEDTYSIKGQKSARCTR